MARGDEDDEAILVEETPPPRRPVRRKVQNAVSSKVHIQSPSPPRASSSKPRATGKKRQVDETLYTGINFDAEARKRQHKFHSPPKSQLKLDDLLPKRDPHSPRHAQADWSSVRRNPPSSRRHRGAGTADDAISVDDDDVPTELPIRNKARFASSRPFARTTSRNSVLSRGSSAGRSASIEVTGESPSQLMHPSQPKKGRLRDRHILTPDEEMLDYMLGSQEAWEASQESRKSKRDSRSPDHRVMVSGTGRSTRNSTDPSVVLVEETAPPKRSSNRLRLGFPSSSRAMRNPFVVNGQSDHHRAKSNSKVRVQPPSDDQDDDDQSALGSVSLDEDRLERGASRSASRETKSRSGSRHRAFPTSVTFDYISPSRTPRKGHPLDGLVRSPSKLPIDISQREPSPPQIMTLGRRKRHLLAMDDDESYRPSPTTALGKAMLKPPTATQKARVHAQAALRPQRVRSEPGKYKLPTVDTPIEQWPTTRGSSGTPARKKLRSDGAEETTPARAVASPAASLSQRSRGQDGRSATRSPLPSHTPIKTPSKQASQLSVRSTLTPLPPAQTRQSLSPIASVASMNLRQPSENGSLADLLDEWAEFNAPNSSAAQLTPSRGVGKRTSMSLSPTVSMRLLDTPSKVSQKSMTSPIGSRDCPVTSPDFAKRVLADAAGVEQREKEKREREQQERLERLDRLAEEARTHQFSEEDEEESDEEESIAKLLERAQQDIEAVVNVPSSRPASPNVSLSKQHLETAAGFKNLFKKRSKTDAWVLATANLQEAEVNDRSTVDAEDVENDVGVGDVTENIEANPNGAISDVDRRQEELEAMSLFWKPAAEDLEPDCYLWNEEEYPAELPSIRGDDELAALLPSGMLQSVDDVTQIGQWLFKIAFGSDGDLAVIAAEQLVGLFGWAEDHPFEDSPRLLGYLEAVWWNLDASHAPTTEDLPHFDVRLDRETSSALICDIASSSAVAGWLLPNESEILLRRLVILSVDASTSPALARAILTATNTLIEYCLKDTPAVRLAQSLASGLSELSTFHQARAVLALGQANEYVRTVVRLLAIELLLPGCLDTEDTPSEDNLHRGLRKVETAIIEHTSLTDWIDISASLTLWVAASSASAASAKRPSWDNPDGKPYGAFKADLSTVYHRITTGAEEEKRAQTAKTRCLALRTCADFMAGMTMELRDRERLDAGGLVPGQRGQTRLKIK